MTIQEVIEPTAEQLAVRNLIRNIKQSIKDDAVSLRTEKHQVNAHQRENGSGSAASAQSRLSTHKLEARARLLIYGALRGKTWEQVENKHAEKNGRLHYYITQAWKTVCFVNHEQTGIVVPMPAWLGEVR